MRTEDTGGVRPLGEFSLSATGHPISTEGLIVTVVELDLVFVSSSLREASIEVILSDATDNAMRDL
jgi:hypothetical protein